MRAPDMLSLEISDNGRGLAPPDLGKARRFGIRGLRERVVTVGGRIDLSSSAQGRTLILSVPIAAPSGAEAAAGRRAAELSHDPSGWGEL